MAGAVCPFHADEWSPGTYLSDGSYAHVCELTQGHPAEAPWHWLDVPKPPDAPGLTGLAEELDLERELPAAVSALGNGWFEYGLVERSYAQRCPHGWARMVAQWSHTALEENGKAYTASTYLARTLGSLSRRGDVAYHPGKGTGRWSYNSDISWWSAVPPGPWEERTSWEDVLGDGGEACLAYMP